MEIIIRKVKDQNGWLSCMSPHPVTQDGTTYKTCEALFQSLRFKGYTEIQKEIQEQKSPMAAKMIARKNRALLNRGDLWDEDPSDIPLMKECLLLKLEQHPELKGKLLATGSETIIEDCTTHDRESARFWGMVFKDGQWIGKNVFGNLWMEIRDGLIKKQSTKREIQ